MTTSITRTALTATFAALCCFLAAANASAQSFCPVTGQPVSVQPVNQPAVAPQPWINPNPTPVSSFFLGVYTQTVTVPMPGGGSPVSGPIAAMIQPISPQPFVQGQRVTNVVPGSPAARAGLEIGDILIYGNNQPLTSKGALINAINRSGGHLQLQVRDVRTGQIRPLHTHPQSQGGPVAYAQR